MSELSDWVRLTVTPGIGGEAARKLLQAFGLPHHIFSAGYSALRSVVTERQAKALCLPLSTQIIALMERTSLWCAEKNNHLITLADALYPPRLLTIPDPPVVLYARGNAELLAKPSIAVVGSRNGSSQGEINARQFSSSLSNTGITIVSGMATGIDTAAHQGGLAGSGSTIAVIGTGADIIYPSRNRDLAHHIAGQGCIVSEYPLGTPSIASNFPRRNRIISGLSHGVLVVEAALQSGSLITARMAVEQGREVFAIPGSIHSPLSKGCHSLIRQGAKLVETAQDILEELQLNMPGNATTSEEHNSATKNCIELDVPDSDVLTKMGFDPVHPDELAQRCKLDCGQLTAQLVMLEMDGRVESIAGGYYRRLN